MADSKFPKHAIAIIGIAGRFPDAADLDAFWRNIMLGVDVLQAFDSDVLRAAGVSDTLAENPQYVSAGTVLRDADLFDAKFFGISPREAQILDPQHRIFLECAWEAIEHAGYARDAAQRTVGVYGGCGINTYFLANTLQDRALVDAVGGYQLMLANDKDFLCTRVSYKLDLRGPSMTIQTACSTSLVAVVEACRALERNECDMALAGGVSVAFPQQAGYLYQEGMILSPDGRCRPFDVAARGTRPGAGAGIVVLKRLDDAIADRDTIHAVIRGAAINNDGAAKAGYTAPSVEGQIEAIARAMALADTPARTIGLVEAHGTATPLGDPIEIAALTRVYRSQTDDIGFCRLGSLKANLGHLDAAAGVASLIKATIAVERGEIPPLVHFTQANPALALASSPFAASAEAGTWRIDGPRRAGVSSFGIGGTNAHVVIEQAPPAVPSQPSRDNRLLLLSARTPEALDRTALDLARWLEFHPEQNLADVEWTLQAGRRDFVCRRAIVATNSTDAIARLKTGEWLDGRHDEGVRPVAFLFSGQGSQHAQMGAALYRSERAYREAFDACANCLKVNFKLDLRDVVFGYDGGAMSQTAIAQPALFAVEYALAQLWMAWGIKPAAMIGHSIGEYVAACLAGVFSLEDALKLVAVRGQAMQEMPPGAMAAVPLSPEALRPWLAGGLEIAAENGPALCTVSGSAPAVDNFIARIGETGVDAHRLHVSHAFHSEMMAAAIPKLRAAFDSLTLNRPSIPYVSNVSGTWIKSEEAMSPDYYGKHMRHTVRFDAGMRTLAIAHPGMAFLEIGPGAALSVLGRGILGREASARVVASMPHPKEARGEQETILSAAGRLWVLGALSEPRLINADAVLRRVPLPTYPFERERYWIEPNAGTDIAPAEAAVPPSLRAFAINWTRSEGANVAPSAARGRWLLVGGPEKLRAQIAERLRAAGAEPEAIDTVTPVADPAGVSGAVILFPLDRKGADEAFETYRDIVAIAKQLETWERPAPARLLIAGAGLARVLDEKTPDPFGAVAFGPVLTLPAECPSLVVRHVDLDPASWRNDESAVADALAIECATEGPSAFVAWRRGRRFVRGFEPIDAHLPEPTLPVLPKGSVVLIPGGLGAIGLKLAQRLAETSAAKVALISRHAPEEAASSAVRSIEALGGEALVAAADLCDRNAMASVIELTETRFGPITAVIHAAGAAGPATLAFTRQDSEVHAVLDAKTKGIAVLVELLGEHPLTLFAAMGSINGVIGAPTLCDYCAANAVLDAFVESDLRPKAWSRVLCVGWGPWRDIGMAARLLEDIVDRSEEVSSRRRSQIPPDQAVAMFERMVASNCSHAVVAMGDITAFEAKAPKGRGTMAPTAPSSAGSRSPGAGPIEAMRGETELKLAEFWRTLLGVSEISATDDFFELGGHSLLATRLMARISDQLGVALTLRDVFEASTIRKLASRIAAVQSADDREELVL